MAAVAGQVCNLLYLVVAWMRVASTARGKIATAQPSYSTSIRGKQFAAELL